MQLTQIVKACRAAHLFRYGSAYIVFAWGTIEFVDMLGPQLKLPPSLLASLVVLWTALFPLFLLFVWIKNKCLVEDLPSTPMRGVDWVVLVALVAVLLISLYRLVGPTSSGTAEASLSSVAAASNAPASEEAVMTGVKDEQPAKVVAIGSKTFLESSLLLEIFALAIQDKHPDVIIERRHFIGETAYVLDELQRENIDLFPEYSGSILAKYLELDRHYQMDERQHDAAALNRRLSNDPAFSHLRVLQPLGFENNYVLVMRAEAAQGLLGGSDDFNISALAEASKVLRLRVGCTYAFGLRQDGIRGLKRFYGLDVGEIVTLLHSQKYSALDSGRVDVIEGYTTDAELASGRYAVLRDDKGFWPSYRALPIVRARFADANPGIVAAIDRLTGQIDEGHIRWALRELERRGYSSEEIGAADFEPLTRVARDLLIRQGIIPDETR